MPPRHTYWTIILEGKPTAFRAAAQDELLPTLKQLQARHPDAVLMWFARGRLWKSEEESRAAYVQKRPPGDRRGPTWRPGGTHEDPRARFKISRDEKRKRFRERLFGDDAPDDREVPVEKLPEGAPPPTPDAPPQTRRPFLTVQRRRIAAHRARGSTRDDRELRMRKPSWKPTGPGAGPEPVAIADGNPVGPQGRAPAVVIAAGNPIGPQVRAPAVAIAAGNPIGPQVRAPAVVIAGGSPVGPQARAPAVAIAGGNPIGPQVRAPAVAIAGGNPVGPQVKAPAVATADGNPVGPQVRAPAVAIAGGSPVGPQVRALAVAIADGNPVDPQVKALAVVIADGNPVDPQVKAPRRSWMEAGPPAGQATG